MVQLTIQKTIDGVPTGTPFSAQVILVYGEGFFDRRTNQTSMRTLDGTIHTFDTGVTAVEGSLVIKGMLPDVKIAFENYLRDELNFNEHTFDIKISSAPVDIGNGVGSDLQDCKFGENFNSTKGMFQHRAPGIYHVKIPYTYIRS